MIRFQQTQIYANVMAGKIATPELTTQTHPHQIIFPLILKLFGIWSDGWWLFYPTFFAAILPVMWIYLGARCRVPMLMSTCLLLSVTRMSMFTHVGVHLTGDAITNMTLVLLVLVVHAHPKSRLPIFFIYFMAMVGHQRSVVLLPGIALWNIYCAYPETRDPRDIKLRAYVDVAMPYILGVLAFFAYRQIYFHFFPPVSIWRELTVTSQLKRMFRMTGPAEAMDGGVLYFLFKKEGFTWNGFFYFSFLVFALGAFMKRHYLLACVPLLLYFGTISQMLVAEDAHRLTGFLFLIVLLLAVEASRTDWPILKGTTAFFVIAAFGLMLPMLCKLGLGYLPGYLDPEVVLFF